MLAEVKLFRDNGELLTITRSELGDKVTFAVEGGFIDNKDSSYKLVGYVLKGIWAKRLPGDKSR